MKLAEVKYHPVYFEVTGPSELLFKLDQMLLNNKINRNDFNWPQYVDLLKTQWKEFLEWGVTCDVTGTNILLAELNYWNVEKQLAFDGPAAALKFHLANTSTKEEY